MNQNRSEVWWSCKKSKNGYFTYHNILNLLGAVFLKRTFYETIKFGIHIFNLPHPGCAEKEKHQGAENRCQQLQAIQFTRRQLVAGNKDDVLIATLRCQCREITAGKEQRKHVPNIFRQCDGCCSLPYQPTPVWSSRFPSLQPLATTPYRRYCIRAS